MNRIRAMYKKNAAQLTVPVIILVTILLFSVMSPNFYKFSNVITILKQISILCIICCGQALVMIGGGLDLSAGSIAVMCGILWSMMELAGFGTPLSVLLSALVGVGIGFVNGFILSRTKIHPMVATLGMSTIITNLVWIMLGGGNRISGLPESAAFLGQGELFGFLPFPVLLTAICLFVNWFILRKTYFGRGLYALGGSEEVARLSGLNTKRTQLMSYVFSGLFAAIGGAVMMSRINLGTPEAGTEYQMDTITACVIGGISFSGGEGGPFSVFLGALLIGIINNGLTVIRVNEYSKLLIRGAVLVFAVGLDAIQQTRAANEKKAIKHAA